MEKLVYNALFSLFHHDVTVRNKSFGFDTKDFYEKAIQPDINSIKDIVDVLYDIVTESISNHTDSQISLTLTGGMDSRVILACLLKAGIKPNCLTYGNSGSADIFFARRLAKDFGLNFHNAVKKEATKAWYYEWANETIKRDNGNSHLHRAHRTAAIAEHSEKYTPKVLFTGHMGGEGLRGLSYNNYFASDFFKSVNEGHEKPIDSAKRVLDAYFIKIEHIDFHVLLNKVYELSWMKHNKETNKFFFLFDLVGKIHHAQDIKLYGTYIPKVIPVFLQEKYLITLFSSPHHFLSKKKGIMGRLTNPYVHCKLIEFLYPKLLDYPLSNGYMPMEYLRGLWYFVPIKTYRTFRYKNYYCPTFSYGKWYNDFIKEHSQNISSEIWEIYDRKKYMYSLKKENHTADEGYWHKYSNPIFFDLVEKQKKGMSL